MKISSHRLAGFVVLFWLVSFYPASLTFAGSATWLLNPSSGDWNTAANWMPNTIPNGLTDVAAFEVSNITDIVIKRAVDTVDHIEFAPNASAFTITVEADNPPMTPKLIFNGSGIINQSGVTQNFVTKPSSLSFGPSLMEFHNGATAGDGTAFASNGPGTAMEFFDDSNAGTATIVGNGDIDFYDDASAASATFISEPSAEMRFFDNATAANGTFVAEGGGFGTLIRFLANSTAGSANFTVMSGRGSGGEIEINDASADHGTFTVEGAASGNSRSGKMSFFHAATAGDATIILKGGLASEAAGAALHFFRGTGTAGNSTIIAESGAGPESGGLVVFDGGTTGGTARLELLGPTGPGTLQVGLSAGDDPATVGSIEGSGRVIIASASGGTTLSIGSNNLNTTFSGLIHDGVAAGGIAKIGTGTLTLTGANTYSGGTKITSGILFVSNASGSGTGTGTVSVNAGTLGGSGIIAGAVTVGTSSGTAALLAPSRGTKKPASLTIQGALTLNDDSTYTYQLNTKRMVADQVIANGVVIDSGAKFSFRPRGNNALTVGQIFTVFNNTAATPIVGTFHNLPEGKILVVNGSNLQASYTGGDGNDLTLTVIP